MEDRCAVDGMIQFIEKDPAQPFFLMAWSQQTHHPYEPTPGVPMLEFVRESTVDGYDLGRYLNVLHETDRHIERLFDTIRRAGLEQDTLIVVTGDHGQAFGDPHDSYMQGRTVYEEDVNVPLLLWYPRRFKAAARSATIGSHIDLAPTIADLAGFPAAPDWQGRSLFDPRRTPRAYFYVAEDHFTLGVREENWKYIFDLREGAEELYDLQPRSDRAAQSGGRAARSLCAAAPAAGRLDRRQPPSVRQSAPMTRRRNRLTRRAWLKELGAAGAGSVLAAGTLIRQPAFAQSAPSSRPVTSDGTITPKTSTSDVFLPPRGRALPEIQLRLSRAVGRVRRLRVWLPPVHAREHLQPVVVSSDGPADRAGPRDHVHGVALGGRAAAFARTRDRAADETRRHRRMRRRRADGPADQSRGDDSSRRAPRPPVRGRRTVLRSPRRRSAARLPLLRRRPRRPPGQRRPDDAARAGAVGGRARAGALVPRRSRSHQALLFPAGRGRLSRRGDRRGRRLEPGAVVSCAAVADHARYHRCRGRGGPLRAPRGCVQDSAMGHAAGCARVAPPHRARRRRCTGCTTRATCSTTTRGCSPS